MTATLTPAPVAACGPEASCAPPALAISHGAAVWSGAAVMLVFEVVQDDESASRVPPPPGPRCDAPKGPDTPPENCTVRAAAASAAVIRAPDRKPAAFREALTDT